MATPRIGSVGTGLPIPNTNSLLISDAITLAGGQKWTIPAGQFYFKTGPYTVIQTLDPITQTWVEYGEQTTDGYIQSDGVNFRLSNLSGCIVGAMVTTSGTGYTTAPTVTAAAGAAKFVSILGGTLSSTVTVATAGVGYNHPPTILIGPPSGQGVPATATTTLTGTGLGTVTMVNQGAGYTVAPTAAPTLPAGAVYNTVFGPTANTYTIVPDPADTPTTQAVLTFGLTAGISTNVTAILVTDPGTAVTQLPALTITAAPASGTTAIATAIPMWTVTAINVTAANAGSGYGSGAAFGVFGPGALVNATRSTTAAGPITDTGLFQPQPFMGYGTATGAGSGSITTAGFVISNAGLHQTTPNLFVLNGGANNVTVGAIATASVGGTTDTSWLTQV